LSIVVDREGLSRGTPTLGALFRLTWRIAQFAKQLIIIDADHGDFFRNGELHATPDQFLNATP
jgi:hypothetical protein